MEYIYLASDCSGLVKIGRTMNIEKRLKTMKTNNPTVSLLFTLKVPKLIGLERLCHNRFKKQRVVGEWFRVEPKKVIIFILLMIDIWNYDL